MDILDFMLSEKGNIREPHFLVVQGDIFKTQANHIAFAVNYSKVDGAPGVNTGGFAGEVAKFIPEVATYNYKPGVPVDFLHKNRSYHALPVHSNETNGWMYAPALLVDCLNKLSVEDEDVIAIVLIGGGEAGEKYGANVKNLAGMLASNKTLALYIHNMPEVYERLSHLSVLHAYNRKDMMRLLDQEPKVVEYALFGRQYTLIEA